MQTIGRNDPCLCGSGRKFKHCCGRIANATPAEPSEQEADWKTDLRSEIGDTDYESMEELQAAVSQFFGRRNRDARNDFHGLSPDQMHRILHFPFDSPRIAEFSDALDSPPDAPFMHLFGMLAELVDRENFKPTARGNLPRRVCRDIAEEYWNEETFPYERLFWKVNKEMDFFDLHVVRVVAGMAGFLRKYKGRFILGRECRALLKAGGLGAAYPKILRVYAQKYNWAYRDGFDELPFLQHSFLFTLFLLSRYGHEWRPSRFYEDQFLHAFPMVLDQIEERFYSTQEKTFRWCYTARVLQSFAGFLGFAEVENVAPRRSPSEYRIRSTRLLAETLTFHV
ncbi:MAG: hypothetical protein BMS9Abin05_0986 [Rhodothermia bacterium]|nr:MAG: hypothetical protein BMS9Abin05_0986 [Rhodothermia bacterium]